MSVKFQHLVLDSGPLIQNSFAPTLSENFWTVPEVVSEIRDVATRERLTRLPFVLTLKNPSAKALQLVRDFSKATGDTASLSTTDIKVIALALTLELEENGDKSLVRTDPERVQVHEGRPISKEKTSGKSKPVVDNDGWITAENIHKVKSELFGPTLSEKQSEDAMIKIGCISTDFAVQNVLLQMRLGLFAPEGYRIRQLKNWLLRCHACYWTTRQMERRFCDRCGNPTLIRTSYQVDEQGVTHLFLKRNFQYNNRGTIAPLPLPQGGRKGNQILLREDQKEYQKAVKSYQRRERKLEAASNSLDAMDDRFATVFGTMNIKGSASDNLTNGPPVVGFGRKNPNQARRRV